MKNQYLLDTHTFLWATGDIKGKLSSKVERLLNGTSAELFLSIVSVWEIGIKSQLGRLRLPTAVDTYVRSAINARALRILPVELEDTARIERFQLHHGDPFGRMLAAQALREDLALVSVDSIFDAYAVRRYW